MQWRPELPQFHENEPSLKRSSRFRSVSRE